MANLEAMDSRRWQGYKIETLHEKEKKSVKLWRLQDLLLLQRILAYPD